MKEINSVRKVAGLSMLAILTELAMNEKYKPLYGRYNSFKGLIHYSDRGYQ